MNLIAIYAKRAVLPSGLTLEAIPASMLLVKIPTASHARRKAPPSATFVRTTSNSIRTSAATLYALRQGTSLAFRRSNARTLSARSKTAKSAILVGLKSAKNVRKALSMKRFSMCAFLMTHAA